jgi:predicted ATPase
VTPEDRKYLKEAIHALRDEPLPPDDPRYVSLHGEPDEGDDPVELMMRTIELSSGESAQLFTGFRGTGKTTALRRLQSKLVQAGYKVVFVDIEDHLDTSRAVNVGEFFLALGSCFGEAMTAPELLGDPAIGEDYWRRISESFSKVGWLRELSVEELKAMLKSRRSSVLHVVSDDTVMAPARMMLGEWVSKLKIRHGDGTQVVLIVDSIDHLHGANEIASSVQQSVVQLFALYADELRLPSMHVVYTVPFHLKLRSRAEILHNLGPVRTLPAVKVRDPQGATHLQGVNALKTLISRSIDSSRLLRNDAQAEKIILSSGGNVRDLQRLLQEVIRRASTLPASARVVDDAIEHMRTGLLSVLNEDLESLVRIARTHDLDIEKENEVSRWEYAHLVLHYRNGREWYDVHPLIRDVVLQRARELPADTQPSAGAEPAPASPRLPEMAAATTPAVLTPEMRVTLVVESYRALRHVRWTLPRGVSALVGPNGSGKTTLLDIPELLRHALQHDVRTAIDERGGPGNLRNAHADRNAPVILGVELDEVTWQLDLTPRGASYSPLQGERATVSAAVAFDRNAPVPGLETRPEDARPLLARFVDLPDGAALRPLVSLLRGYRLYHGYDLASIRVNGSQVSSDEYLHPDGRNIFSVLRNWRDRKETRPRWEFVIESLRAAFPDTFADLDFDMAGQTVSGRIVAPQPDVRIATYFAANGWLVALLHLAAVASTEPAGAVAIDEVENGLHPFAIREIIDAMRRWAEKTGISVVLATHSPVVLDQFKEEPWNLFVMEAGRDTAPVPLDELHDPEWLAHFSLGDLYAHDEFGAQNKDDQQVA